MSKGVGEVRRTVAAGQPVPRQPDDADPFEGVKNAFVGAEADDEHSRQGWFLYFWREAVARAGKGDFDASAKASPDAKQRFKAGAHGAKARLTEIYSDVLRGDSSQAKLASLHALSPRVLLEALTDLLHIGFRGVPLAASPAMGSAADADNILHFCRKGALASGKVDVAWRSETRSWADIVRDKGTRRQVDVTALATKYNMRQPWHPYSQPSIRNHMWFRAGTNMDNCFYSAVSVGPNLKTVVNFPTMDGKNYPDLPKIDGQVKSVRSWTEGERLAFGRHVARVWTSTGEQTLVGTVVHAYLVLVNGLVLDTAKVAEYYHDVAFPELGVESIALDDIYACYFIVRVHHETPYRSPTDRRDYWICDRNSGHTVFIGRTEYMYSESQRRCRYASAEQDLVRALNAVPPARSPHPAFSARWDQSGWEKVPSSITRLVSLGGVTAIGPGLVRPRH